VPEPTGLHRCGLFFSMISRKSSGLFFKLAITQKGIVGNNYQINNEKQTDEKRFFHF
jgi:hypothetical protein